MAAATRGQPAVVEVAEYCGCCWLSDPDGLVDMLPGTYGTHGPDGNFQPHYKDRILAFAQGDIYLGAIPMLDGHIWDSLFRVIVAMAFGVLLGVPLGIYMGVSRFSNPSLIR